MTREPTETEIAQALCNNDVHTLLAAKTEHLRAEIERLTEAHERIVEWSRAYPLTIFPEPDLKKARALLEAGGMTLDTISAHAMRHVVERAPPWSPSHDTISDRFMWGPCCI
jgi:hypothetical protein